MFAKGKISKGQWLCEYKTHRIYDWKERTLYEEEYKTNDEGCYIVDSKYNLPGVGHLCFDATRCYQQIGRYLNHAKSPNATLTQPIHVCGKWRIGFLAIRDINIGDEVVWDYGVEGDIWSSCRLEGGVVKPSKRMVAESMEEVEEGNAESDEAATAGQSEENHSRAVRRAYSQQPRKRRLCYCPI